MVGHFEEGRRTVVRPHGVRVKPVRRPWPMAGLDILNIDRKRACVLNDVGRVAVLSGPCALHYEGRAAGRRQLRERAVLVTSTPHDRHLRGGPRRPIASRDGPSDQRRNPNLGYDAGHGVANFLSISRFESIDAKNYWRSSLNLPLVHPRRSINLERPTS